jgi:hypothetical protein
MRRAHDRQQVKRGQPAADAGELPAKSIAVPPPPGTEETAWLNDGRGWDRTSDLPRVNQGRASRARPSLFRLTKPKTGGRPFLRAGAGHGRIRSDSGGLWHENAACARTLLVARFDGDPEGLARLVEQKLLSELASRA